MKPINFRLLGAIICLSGGVFLSGCATAKLGSGPDVFALPQLKDRPVIGVSKVTDTRGGTQVGTIGAAGIRVKANDLTALTTNYLLNTLSSKLDMNIQTVANFEGSDMPHYLKLKHLNGYLTASVTRLKMFSADAIMQPVETNLDLQIKVYDQNGEILYDQTVSGSFEKRIGLSIVDKSTGELVNSVVEKTMEVLAQDSSLRKALESLKND